MFGTCWDLRMLTKRRSQQMRHPQKLKLLRLFFGQMRVQNLIL